MDSGVVEAVINQVAEAQEQYPDLELTLTASGELQVVGAVCFDITHENRRAHDEFELRIVISDDYPESPPTVYEVGGKIPADFGHFMKAGNLCLGAPVEIRGKFAQHRNLLRFINEQVIPYLFSYSYKRDHGVMPYGERDHASLGLIDYYKDVFGTDGIAVMKLLKLLADDCAPPLMRCPCKSGQVLKNCHGGKLDELRGIQPASHFEAELRSMVRLLQASNYPFSAEAVAPKRMLKQINRKRRR